MTYQWFPTDILQIFFEFECICILWFSQIGESTFCFSTSPKRSTWFFFILSVRHLHSVLALAPKGQRDFFYPSDPWRLINGRWYLTIIAAMACRWKLNKTPEGEKVSDRDNFSWNHRASHLVYMHAQFLRYLLGNQWFTTSCWPREKKCWQKLLTLLPIKEERLIH